MSLNTCHTYILNISIYNWAWWLGHQIDAAPRRTVERQSAKALMYPGGIPTQEARPWSTFDPARTLTKKLFGVKAPNACWAFLPKSRKARRATNRDAALKNPHAKKLHYRCCAEGNSKPNISSSVCASVQTELIQPGRSFTKRTLPLPPPTTHLLILKLYAFLSAVRKTIYFCIIH